MKQVTIRNVPEELAVALEKEKKRRGSSLNQTMLDLLQQALGVRSTFTNGLEKLSGGWNKTDLAEFEKNTQLFEVVDDELWK